MIKTIQASSLHKIFRDSTFKTFTPKAISSGVNNDSIIFITCKDDTEFGEKFEDGAAFIWARGKFYGEHNAYSVITEQQVINLVNEIVKL